MGRGPAAFVRGTGFAETLTMAARPYVHKPNQGWRWGGGAICHLTEVGANPNHLDPAS
jgi:hypothetical protein